MSIKNYCEHNAGRQQQWQPSQSDIIEFDQPVSEGIEVREYATLGDFLRALKTDNITEG